MLFAAGCSCGVVKDVEPTIQFSADSLTTYFLEGTILPGSDSLGDHTVIAVTATHILVGDDKATRPIQLLNKTTGKWVASAGGRGEGPGDINVRSVDFAGGLNSGWAYDGSSRSMIRLNIDSLIHSPSLESAQRIRLEVGGFPTGPVGFGDGFVSTGYFFSGRLAFYAGDGSFQRSVGPTPPGPSRTPPPIRQQAFQAFVNAKPGAQKIAIVSRHTDRLELYDGEELEHLVRGPDFFEPVYTVVMAGSPPSPAFVQPPEMRFGYGGITSTDRLVFALYSGRSMAEAPGYANYGQYVIVFTWTGQPMAILDFDGDSFDIAVSPDGTELFAAFDTPVPAIVRYTLPPLID